MTIAKSCLEAAQVICPPELPVQTGKYCNFILNIGMFFDGTDNNKDRDMPTKSQSNIARLSEAYRQNPLEGFFAHYIPGVGTPFPELGTDGENILEAAAGKGGEPRIVWGLLQILNSVHAFVNQRRTMFNIEQMRALCSTRKVAPKLPKEWAPPSPIEVDNILRALDLDSGLVDHPETRERFFKKCANDLKIQLAECLRKPRAAAIYLDIFGFSRGATQARVFTNWLHQYFFIKGNLFGKPSYVRMLGLMDTVASVGFTNAAGGDGHWDWATPENLQIHKDVKNCVHYVALHELRTVFPCDSVCFNKALPPNCHEHYYPGAHSDVGGGYAPGFQGKAVTSTKKDPFGKPVGVIDDSRKLSQLPLNDMYQAARKVCELHGRDAQPWLEITTQTANGTNPLTTQFALDPEVRTAVQTYFAHCKIKTNLSIDHQLREHGLLYLAWRYRVNKQKQFERLPSVHYASQLDPNSLRYYREGQAIFAEQIKEVAKPAWVSGPGFVLDLLVLPTLVHLAKDRVSRRFSKHAKPIYKRIGKNTAITSELSQFFDNMVHDSYAGFIKSLGSELARDRTEGEGYLRYRGVYLGDNTRLNAMVNVPEQKFA